MKRTIRYILSIIAIISGVQGVAQEKYVGGDISLLPSYEAAKTPYYTPQGGKINDLVSYAAETLHWNSCRVRVFVDPVITNADSTKQGEVQDIEYACALGKRIKDAGMSLLLDFHYSDTWADPVKQSIPGTWQSLSEEQLLDTVYGYTAMCLRKMVAAGATPDFVQIGNEVSYGMLWRGTPSKTTDAVHAYDDSTYDTEVAAWQRFGAFLNNGARAVREVCPNAKVIVHIERTQNATMCNNFYTYIGRQNVDYDVIGLSYYPFWHGWLDHELHNTLTILHNNFPDKPIQIVETAYYNNYWPTSGVKYDTRSSWAASPAGQEAYLSALISKLNTYDFVNGLYYWFPEENGNGGASWSANNIVITTWINRGLFDPNNHKAYGGLYRLSEYIGVSSAVENATMPNTNQAIYSLSGTLMGYEYDKLPAGTYIQNGQIRIKQ